MIDSGRIRMTNIWNSTVHSILKEVMGLQYTELTNKFICSVFWKIANSKSKFRKFNEKMIEDVYRRKSLQDSSWYRYHLNLDFLRFMKSLLSKMTLKDFDTEGGRLSTTLKPFFYLVYYSYDSSLIFMNNSVTKCYKTFEKLKRPAFSISKKEWEDWVRDTCFSVYVVSKLLTKEKEIPKNGDPYPLFNKFDILVAKIFILWDVFNEESKVDQGVSRRHIGNRYPYLTKSLINFLGVFWKVHFKSQYFPTELIISKIECTR